MLRVSNKQKRKDTSSGRICNSLPKTSSRCLRKTCSRRLQDVFFKTSSIFLQEDVLQLYLEDVFETSSVRLHQTNVCWGHAWGMGGGGGNLTMWRSFCNLQKRPSSPLQFNQEEDIPVHSIERRAY